MSDQVSKPKERDDELRAKIDKVAQALGFDSIKLADGFDGAIVAVGTRFIFPVAIYNYDVCVEMLADQNMAHAESTSRTEYTRDDALDEAEEYMQANVTGAHVGEDTPVFVRFTTNALDELIQVLS